MSAALSAALCSCYRAASHAVPNGLKSDEQDARDFATPGNDSGLLDRVGNKVSGATAVVRSAFGGNPNGHADQH